MPEKIKRELQDISDFSKITLNNFGDITLQQGDKYQVIVEGVEELLDHLDIHVNKNTLILDFDDEAKTKEWQQVYKENADVAYTITLPKLEFIRIAGYGTLTATDLSGDTLALMVSGVGNMTIDSLQYKRIALEITGVTKSSIQKVAADEVALSIKGTANLKLPDVKADSLVSSIKGSATIKIAGRIPSHSISVPGSGTFHGELLESDTVQIISNGMTKANLWINSALNVKANGVAMIAYYGNPTIQKKVNGVGQIKQLGGAPKAKA